MTEIIDMTINYGAGVVSLGIIFYFVWYVIQNITPALIDVKSSMEMNIEVIKNNTKVMKEVTDSLNDIKVQNDTQAKDHLQMSKNYEVHNERTIRLEQSVGILLDRNNLTSNG